MTVWVMVYIIAMESWALPNAYVFYTEKECITAEKELEQKYQDDLLVSGCLKRYIRKGVQNEN